MQITDIQGVEANKVQRERRDRYWCKRRLDDDRNVESWAQYALYPAACKHISSQL